jgi:hypothetical protein
MDTKYRILFLNKRSCVQFQKGFLVSNYGFKSNVSNISFVVFQIKIWIDSPAILTDSFCCVPQSFQANPVIMH